MARKTTDEAHFLTFSLIAVFLIAILTIFGMVVLVSQGPSLEGTRLASGVQPVAADGYAEDSSENLVGDLKRKTCPPKCPK